MKPLLYITVLILFLSACSANRNFSSTVEDDIYYVPGKKALVVKEVEELTGQEITLNDEKILAEKPSRYAGSSTPPAAFSRSQSSVVNTRSGQLEQINLADMTEQAQEIFANNDAVETTLYENAGYWIGGYRGSENELSEIQRIINLYPQGFGYFNSNGQNIAIELSFDPDWNVYTDNGRYWWFPSNTNINLYSSLLFGTYPKYIWTVAWDNPRFDSWAFNNSFNSGFNIGFNTGWYGSSGWGFNIGWNTGWYNPCYNNWYGWNHPWYGGYYPGCGNGYWHHPHWGHDYWGDGNWGNGNYPNWGPPSANRPPLAGHRPGNGGGVSGIRPGNPSRPSQSFRPGSSTRPSGITRPNTTTRPNTGSSIRPGSATTRPGITRPGSNTQQPIRPGSGMTRPNVTRPNNNQQQQTRPGSTRPAVRPNSNMTRPATSPTRQPATRPSTSNNQYTRPATGNNGNIKNYSRPQNNSRPTYNNNSSTRYNSGSNSMPTRSNSGSSYSPQRNGGNTGGASRTGTVTRPTRR
ncbi:MAG: hypothetical protein RSA53_02280 [Odoribacter sp.]